VPSTGALFGAYVDPDNRWVDNRAAMDEVTAFESMIGRKIAINQHYYGFSQTFPSGLEQWDIANGRIPLVSWMGTSLTAIAGGSYDGTITARADALKALGAPVFLRFAWEMNGDWYAWDGSHNNDSGTYNGPAKYIAAWRRVHDIFAARGATNVVWVWAPNHESVPNVSWNNWRNYYPGDAYVDWVGIDGYNWGTTRSWSSWKSFPTLFSDVYRDYAPSKPIMISEIGSVEQGGDKGAWISAASSSIKTSFPAIKAFLWFDVLKEADWRADSSAGSLSAYEAMGRDSYFNP